jgi:hypothetical protein
MIDEDTAGETPMITMTKIMEMLMQLSRSTEAFSEHIADLPSRTTAVLLKLNQPT